MDDWDTAGEGDASSDMLPLGEPDTDLRVVLVALLLGLTDVDALVLPDAELQELADRAVEKVPDNDGDTVEEIDVLLLDVPDNDTCIVVEGDTEELKVAETEKLGEPEVLMVLDFLAEAEPEFDGEAVPEVVGHDVGVPVFDTAPV